MTRDLSDKKYVVWLAGYYDDFEASICIPDDKNAASDLSFDHEKTHHGNTVNGEAPLNPIFRHSVIERDEATGKYTTTGMQRQAHNEGIHKYLTKDTVRLSGGVNWEGRATTRSPQTYFHSNRVNTGITNTGVTTDGYMWVNNPRRTGAKYYFYSSRDGSFGRDAINIWDDSSQSNTDGTNTFKVRKGTSMSHETNSASASNLLPASFDFGARADTSGELVDWCRAGYLQWTRMNIGWEERPTGNTVEASKGYRQSIGQTITSPSGKPFMLCDARVKAYKIDDGLPDGTFELTLRDSGSSKLLCAYDGTLNAIGDNDTFHIRLAHQSFTDQDLAVGRAGNLNQPKWSLQVGFLAGTTSASATGLSNTPAITQEIPISALAGGVHHHIHKGAVAGHSSQSTTSTATAMTDIWGDIDFVLDFTNQRYTWYIDGVAQDTNVAFASRPGGGAWTASDFYGWQLKLESGAIAGYVGAGNGAGTPTAYMNYSWQVLTMIDRVGLLHPVTDHVSRTNDVLVESMQTKMASNKLMSGNMQIIDDNNRLNIYKLLSGASSAEWLVMVSRNGDDRVIVTGTISRIRISQALKQATRAITVEFSDPAKNLDRQLPMWEIGQGALTTTTDSIEQRRGLAEKLSDILYFGAAKLTLRDDKIGYITSAYEELNDQRTSLYSSHPIQMYNDEDNLGPNSVEDQWTGRKILGFSKGVDDSGGAGSEAMGGMFVHCESVGVGPNTLNGTSHTIGGGSKYDATTTAVEVCQKPAARLFFGDDTDTPNLANCGDTILFTGITHSADATVAFAKRYVDGGTSYYALYLTPGHSGVPAGITGNTIAVQNPTSSEIADMTAAPHPYLTRSGTNDYPIFTRARIVTVTHNAQLTVSGTQYDVLYTDGLWSDITDGDSSIATSNAAFYTKNGAGSNTPYEVSYGQGTLSSATLVSGSPWDEVANRVNHAVWMKDLPKSLWFKKMFGRIKELPVDLVQTPSSPEREALTTSTFTAGSSTTVTTDVTHTSAVATAILASGVGEFHKADGQVDSFCFNAVANVSGKVQLQGVKFASLTHAIGTTIKIRDIDDDYKHIWVLWADMRNSGEADADGSTRKKDFGLLYPTPDNYSISLQYTDQTDIDGNVVNFVSLAVGNDCDIWEVDSTIEPYTAGTWSALGSDSLSQTQFQNWQNKAGAFLIIDFSKFFNLNTEANGGRTSQISGGRTTLGDLVLDTEGFPALIDDYWQEAAATPANAASPISYHPNWYNFFSAGSNLRSNQGSGASQYNIRAGDTTVVLDDTSEFPNKGIGFIELERESNANTNERNILIYTWTGNNTSTNTLSGVSITDVDETTMTQDEMLAFALNSLAFNTTSGLSTTITTPIRYNDSINNINDGYDKIVFYSGMSAPLALRFMMHLDGYVEAPNIGSFHYDEMLRIISVLSSSEHPMTQFSMPLVFNHKNVPITRRMTTTQQAVSGSVKKYDLSSGSVQDWDTYGASFDARGKSLMSIFQELSDLSRTGLNGVNTVFTYTTGRDGRMDFRPAYSSGFAFTRDNLQVSSMSGSPISSVSNVRVYYNNGASFVDHPAPTLGTENRWKVIELPSIRSHREALSIAQTTYQKAQTPSLKIKAQFVTQLSETSKMLYEARHGYILDPAHRTVWPELWSSNMAATWTSWHNGMHYSGEQNALDGNVLSGNETSPTATTGNVLGQGSSGGMASGQSSSFEPYATYKWVGTKSITEAVKIVHIPKGMPKVSDASGEMLRVGILLADNYAASGSPTEDDVEFYLALIDPNTTYTTATSGHTGVSTDHQIFNDGYHAQSSLKFKHSGLHEIEIPNGYWASETGNERIIVSINAEYLRALLRVRNGDLSSGTYKYANAHDVAGFNTTNGGSNVREQSPFPLGLRTEASVPTGTVAPIFHAPRLSIVDDINFYPSTVVSYTDDHLGISTATNFVIQAVDWSVNRQDTDSVTLTLERDESRAIGNLASYIMPEVSKSRTPSTSNGDQQQNPSSGNNGGGNGSSGLIPTAYPPRHDGGQGTNTAPSYGGDVIGGGTMRNFSGVGVGGGSTGVTGQHFSNKPLGVNNTTSDMLDRVKGKMDLQSEFGGSDGDFSILGSKNKGATSLSQSAIDGVNAVRSSSSGALMSEEGDVLPGAGVGDLTATQPIHNVSYTIPVPENVVGKLVVVDAVVSLEELEGSAKVAVVKTTIECVETGESLSVTTGIPSDTLNTQFTLGSVSLEGASTVNNTIKVTIERQAGNGTDTALETSLVLHNVRVRFNRATNPARSGTSRILGFKSNGVRGLK